MVIIAILIALLFIKGNIIEGIIFCIIYFFLAYYNFNSLREKKNKWKEFIEDFSQNLDEATRNTLVNLPFPLLIVGEKGNISWYNNRFSAIMDKEDILSKSINYLIKDFDMTKSLNGDKSVYNNIKINERYYDAHTSIVNTSDKNYVKHSILILYFYDVTTNKQNIEAKENIMLIEVDNLDEVIKSTEEDMRPLLVAEIERTINSYAQSLNAMIRKYSSNKYVLSVQSLYIEKEMRRKFEILDSIREINLHNKLAVTLSVGVGRGGKNPLENHNYANKAKELALGRGGDQVVIKDGEKLSFYGGNTKEVEKRTKVKARVIAHSLNDLISESSNVFIMGHRNPDMDCLGAAVGLSSAIKKKNKECYVVLQDRNNSIKYILDKLSQHSEYDKLFLNPEGCKDKIDDNSLLILVDVHSMGYVQDADVVNLIKRRVIIDHHRRNPDFIEDSILTYIETYASSTSELVTEMIQYMLDKPKLTQIEAEALLAGICLDTKNFYFKTGVRTFEAASFLRRLGADTIDVKKMFGHDLSSYLRKAEIIKSAVVENNIAIATCPPDIQDTIIAAQAADELLNITGIQASFVLVTIDKDVNISGRSLGDINVQVILESLGGGGHMTMAGAKIYDASLDEAVQSVKMAITKYLREGDKK
ncbi:DHH family phosphoesterase [Clostridium sp. MSJ-4]|uniref:Cyclic-di-AMP phosphodiesterase n=1 Tax=Clostridium simiarum TaxID=2841506 RepID=A0ABS6F1J7_9CLOT|nr:MULTISPECIES: DHH family phosphoesterase [Clostridium]MBU5592381.1 DHH family phosphoesterase [Clostridium simiarum]